MSTANAVRVNEFYSDFEDRFHFRRTVKEALRLTPSWALAGLDQVTLRDVGSLTRDEAKWQVPSQSGRKQSVTLAKGLYFERKDGRGARIELYCDNILREAPTWAFRARLVREFLVAGVLFHEIGHHVYAFVKPEGGEPEKVANRWGEKLLREYMVEKFRWIRLLRAILRSSKRFLRRVPCL